jgi:hypothetical protein
MHPAIRVVLALIVFPAVWLFSYWLFFAQIVPENALALAEVLALATAFLAAWFVWRRTASAGGGFLSAVFGGAVILGSITFAAGFFGPMVFMPEANQGPLLGLFITGPLGFIAGGVLGALWHLMRGGGPTTT